MPLLSKPNTVDALYGAVLALGGVAAFDAFPQAELIDDGGAAPQRREIPWSRNA